MQTLTSVCLAVRHIVSQSLHNWLIEPLSLPVSPGVVGSGVEVFEA